jgi:hypothetical protein
MNYWNKLDLIHNVTKKMLDNPDDMPVVIKQFYEQGISDQGSTKEDWKIQGIKLFKKRYYDQAIKCFNFSGDPDLVKRCEAH